MVKVNKDIATETVQWLEVLLDECPTLSTSERGAVQTLINFWRLYCSFTSD